MEWRQQVQKIDDGICRDPFPTLDEILENIAKHSVIINDVYESSARQKEALLKAEKNMVDGAMTSLNYGSQPFIATVYGPTGSGKSQFIRNIISTRLIEPPPRTIIFITPEVNTITKEEKLSWEAQVVEGNYDALKRPQSSSLQPDFLPMAFHEVVTEQNLNMDDEQNIFCKYAQRGPICVIFDECMNILGSHASISRLFHALPSKIVGRYPKCNGFSLIVVLHNMNPRHDRGNIKDLKIQSKCHIISPQLESSQIKRFIKAYSFGFPQALLPVLKDIVDHARTNDRYSWLIYNNIPAQEAFRWSFYSPKNGLRPIYMNIQSLYYETCNAIRRIFRKRFYSQMQYIRALNKIA